MVSRYEKKVLAPISGCDYSGRMCLSGLAGCFMDMATEHAETLGIGMEVLAKEHLFWLSIRTRVDIVRSPELAEPVTFATWTEKPQKIVYDRDYAVVDAGGETIVRGKTQWGLYNFATGRLEIRPNIYPAELENFGSVFDEPFYRFADEPCGEPVGTYTVKSIDIDLGGHMNNVAYLRAFESLFPVEQRKERDFRSVEIQYKKPCFEGDAIEFTGGRCEKGYIAKGTVNGETAVWLLLRG